MKKTYTIILLLLTAPIIATAQNLAFNDTKAAYYNALFNSRESRLEKAVESFQRGLNHQFPAIVESSMFNLLVLKIDYPDMDFTKVLKKLDDLQLYGKTSVVRYKAHVTTEFIKNPSMFLDVDPSEFNQYMDVEKADHFYLALSKVLQNQLTTLNNY